MYILQNGKGFSKDSNFPHRCTVFTYRFFPKSVETMLFEICTKDPRARFARTNYFPRGEELNNGVNRVEG